MKETSETMFNNGKIILNLLVSVCLAVLGIAFTSYFFDSRTFSAHAVWKWVVCGVFVVAWALFAFFFFKGCEKTYKLFLTGFLFADLIATLLFVYQITGLDEIVYDTESLRKWIDSTGVWAPVVFIVLQFLQTVILPIPTVVTVAAGVVCFGAWRCSLYSYVGCVTGSIVAFSIGRKLGYRAVVWLLGKETVDSWLKKVKRKDIYLLTGMFLLPFFPDDVLCFVAGLSSMSLWYFIGMIMVSRAISIATTAFPLHFIPFNTWWGLLIWGGIFLVVILAMIFLYRNADRLQTWLRARAGRLRTRVHALSKRHKPSDSDREE